jgi:hypothetical protein
MSAEKEDWRVAWWEAAVKPVELRRSWWHFRQERPRTLPGEVDEAVWLWHHLRFERRVSGLSVSVESVCDVHSQRDSRSQLHGWRVVVTRQPLAKETPRAFREKSREHVSSRECRRQASEALDPVEEGPATDQTLKP